jgi:hypothetical protein
VPGIYSLAAPGQRPGAGFRADAATAASADGWARLSLLAARSGGGVLPADSLRQVLDRLESASPASSRGPSAVLIFALLLVAATAEWAIRRLTGRA